MNNKIEYLIIVSPDRPSCKANEEENQLPVVGTDSSQSDSSVRGYGRYDDQVGKHGLGFQRIPFHIPLSGNSTAGAYL